MCIATGHCMWIVMAGMVASFPGPAQLFVACSTETARGPGNEATGMAHYLLGLYHLISNVSHTACMMTPHARDF